MRRALRSVVIAGLGLGTVFVAGLGAQEATAAKVGDLLAKMTLEQKLELIGGQGMTTTPLPGLGLPVVKMSDGPAGLRTWGPGEAYPAGIALAATWDPALVYKVGESLAADAKARGVNVLLAPGVNIYREPMNGRNFEYFGEDPYLAARMAVQYIEGVQAHGVAATVKHFAANNSEFDRHNSNSVVEERALHEIYLPAFEAAVKEAHVAAVMDSYNLVNGAHMTENGPLNVDLLKRKWGFPGVLMSDWNATYDGVAAANNGLDLEMPRAKFMTVATLRDAVKGGTVSESTIDDKVRRILGLTLRYGTPVGTEAVPGPMNTAAARRIAYDAAAESIVLLKNEGGLLPFDAARMHRVAVIGPAVYPLMSGGGGSSYTTTLQATDLYTAMVARARPGTEILYSAGMKTESEIFAGTAFEGGLKQEMYEGDAWAGTTQVMKMQHVDYWTPNFRIGNGEGGEPRSYRWTGTFKAKKSGDYVFMVGAHGGDSFRLYVDNKLMMEHVKSEGTGPKSLTRHLDAGAEIAVKLEYVQRGGKLYAGLGIVPMEAMLLPEVKKLAASADAVVVEIGYGSLYEGEALDRSWHLPAGQDELVKSMMSANAKTIVVLHCGGGADISGWVEQVPGLIHAFYGGEEGGNALADVLTGVVNPSGKLPISFERQLEDNGSFNSYYPKPGTVDVPYGEGIFVGYRHFDQAGVKPLFPFGFGLSYTTFALSGLRVTDTGGGNVGVELDVRNAGERVGDEVVEVYVGESKPAVVRPVRELKAFQRVHLGPGETRHITLALDARAFSYWDTQSHDWKRDRGAFSVMAGDSSASVPLKQTLELKP